MRRDDRGAVIVYVSLMIALLVGLGALAVDVGRYVTLNTQLQNAVDAAALAGARELDRLPGSRKDAVGAAIQAVQNFQTWADDGGGSQVTVSDAFCGLPGDEPDTGCIRFLRSLPPSDETAIRDQDVIDVANNVDDADADAEARFIEVRLGSRTMSSFFVTALGADPDQATTARTIAGNDEVVCEIPPLFMCNPAEGAGNTNKFKKLSPGELNDLEGRQLRLFLQASGQFTPGNFGLLCPLGTEDVQNCGGSSIKASIASISGTCVQRKQVTTKTGVTLGQVRAGFNARFDYWLPQAWDQDNGDWRQNDDFAPAVNVTQGGGKPKPNPTGGQTQCEYDDPAPNEEARRLPRDDCFEPDNCNAVNGPQWPDFVGTGDWNFEEYLRINHPQLIDNANAGPVQPYIPGCDGDPNTDCASGGRPSWWSANSNWPPTRFDVYRMETEQVAEEGGTDIFDFVSDANSNEAFESTETGENINVAEDGTPQSGVTTGEHGATQCFQGTQPTQRYSYLDDGLRDLDLLKDRRVMPIALANCNALGNPSGKFSFKPPEFIYVFLTEAMDDPSNSAMYAEILGTLDEGAMDSLVRDVVQIYRR